MLIEPILGYKSTWRILELLLETPRKAVSRPELLEHTWLGNAPLSQSLRRLVSANILIKEKKGKKEFYYLNLGNEYLLTLQGIWGKERKSLHYLDYDLKVILSELTRPLLEFSGIKEIILFGSQAKGTASIQSDIDLAVIFENKTTAEIEITKIVKVIKEKFNKEIQIHYFTEKSFMEKNILVNEIKSEGISLLK